MKQHTHFDFIIIGNGLAGLQLALQLTKDSFFETKRIALIDPSEKNTNDKTWSFWETDASQWDSIVYKSWRSASVKSSQHNIALDLQPYTYKTIRSLDFYNYALSKLTSRSNVQCINERVISISEHPTLTVTTDSNIYEAQHVFDSRIPETFLKNDHDYLAILQHFKGWVIQTKTPVFDDTSVTMMDFRIKDGAQTVFTYVLPFSATEALVEFTYFTENLVDDTVYDLYLKRYIKEILQLEDYTVIETEQGQIPMTTFPFEAFNTAKVTKIGTAGGWVKGSTGYAFKHTEKKVATIIENLKTGNVPSTDFFKRRYKFYDKVFLKVLKDDNHKGEWLFEQFYRKNSIDTMFRFLDEESSFFEELKIMASLFSWSFIKAFFKTL